MSLKALIQKLQQSEAVLSKIENALIIIILFATMFIAVTQIVLRNGFSSGLSWADPALKMLVLYITIVGSIIATRENKHLSIDVLSKFLPVHLNLIVQKLTNIFASVICLLMSFFSLQLLLLSKKFEDVAFNGIPLWVLQIILPLGFLIMAIRFLINNFNSSHLPNSEFAITNIQDSDEAAK